jgi:hypothetical protein
MSAMALRNASVKTPRPNSGDSAAEAPAQAIVIELPFARVAGALAA